MIERIWSRVLWSKGRNGSEWRRRPLFAKWFSHANIYSLNALVTESNGIVVCGMYPPNVFKTQIGLCWCCTTVEMCALMWSMQCYVFQFFGVWVSQARTKRKKKIKCMPILHTSMYCMKLPIERDQPWTQYIAWHTLYTRHLAHSPLIPFINLYSVRHQKLCVVYFMLKCFPDILLHIRTLLYLHRLFCYVIIAPLCYHCIRVLLSRSLILLTLSFWLHSLG